MVMNYPKSIRLLWYRQAEREKKTVKETCRIFNIPRKTYYKWWNRDHGYGSNDYHSPKQDSKTKLTQDIKSWITIRKRKTNYGPLKMKIELKREFNLTVSTTIIYRFYRRKGLLRKRQRKLGYFSPLTNHLIIKKPGEGVQLDVKYVYDKGIRHYQFSVLDPYTEKHFFEVYATRESKYAAETLRLAEKEFGFPILSVQTDNGSEFRGDFHAWCEKQNIPHFFIPKSSPYWNGKVERVHRTIDDEYYQNPRREWKTAKEWLTYYNGERIHLSIGGMTPNEKVEEYLSSVTP